MLTTFLLAASLASLVVADDALVTADVVFKGGVLVDGTGAARRKADVAVKGDRIVAVGTFAVAGKAKVVRIDDLIIAPGFIDLHNHSDTAIVKPATRANLNYQSQGVTTIVTGNCGGGALSVSKYFGEIDAKPPGTNVIHLVPLGSVRESVMGNAERGPTPNELDAMRNLVDRGMKAGAWGVSSGLIYMPGRYAETSELVALSKVAAKYGGIYASHIRDEGPGLLDSITEAIKVGEGANLPVHISHLKATGKANWGLVNQACARIAGARNAGLAVTADQYPYVASSTSLAAMVIPHWALQGNTDDFSRIANDPARGRRLREEIQKDLDGRDGGQSIRIARYAPKTSQVGKDLAAIAQAEGTTPVELVIDIQRNGGAQAISFGMSEEDVRTVMKFDFVATASDGSAHLPNSGDQPHPRAYGTFPRKIRYARDDAVITLEQAIRSSTGLPASILRIPDRGVIKPGAVADIVVFDPNQFRDVATFEQPTRYANGVRHLYVNGVAAIAEGKVTNVHAGRALRLQHDGPPDMTFTFGKVWTGDPQRPWAESIASRAGQVVGVGSTAEMKSISGPNTRVIDRPEAFATPGLIDSHGHVADLGAGQDEIDLRGIASLDEVAKKVKEKIAATPGNGWITGQSWDQSLWPGGVFPTAATLDAVAPDRPVWLRRVDGHAGWANSEAMRRAKVTKESRAPSDGQIIRENGEPTGVFIDGAMNIVGRAIPSPGKAELSRRILEAQKLILQAGLTGVHDAGVSALEAEAYRDLDRAGKLKLRVYGMASLPDKIEVSVVRKPPLVPKKDARFTLRAVKAFIDGAMGSRGGLLFEPYSDDPGNMGLMLIESKTLEAVTVEALKNGWQVCTHAIGDKGNALVLNAYDSARKKVPNAVDPRLRIEHAQVVRKEDLVRFKTLGVIASMQPSHASTDKRWADARLGPGRVDGAYAWKWFADAKIPLAFGSDFPVEVTNPFWGIYAGITRQDEKKEPSGGWHPEQRLTLEETLKAFTSGSAYAQFAEDRLGLIREGMRADFTVVDRDLFRASPDDVLKAKIVMTVVDGEIVYESATQ